MATAFDDDPYRKRVNDQLGGDEIAFGDPSKPPKFAGLGPAVSGGSDLPLGDPNRPPPTPNPIALGNPNQPGPLPNPFPLGDPNRPAPTPATTMRAPRFNMAQDGPVDLGGNTGIAGPQETGVAAPAPAPQAQGGYDLEALRRAWTAQGIGAQTSPEALKAFLASRPDIASGVTVGGKLGDALFDPQGRFIADAIGDVGGRNTVGFLDNIDSSGKPRVKGGKAGKGGVPAGAGMMQSDMGGAGGAGGGGLTVPPAANGFLTQIRQQIMDRLGRMSQDPTLDDPALAAQSAAYRRSRERGADSERAAMAERAAQQGLIQGGQSSGAFDTNLQGIREAASEDISGNDAAILGAEIQQRRAEVQSLMNMALQSGDAEAARALQMQLANLDAQLRRESMRMQDRHFGADLGYRNRALAQSGRQFDDTFGRTLGRDYEDDYRWRALYGLGG